VGVEPTTSGL